MKVDKKFYFLAGLPRSGSTLLASILNQNNQIYATTTSPLIDLLYLNEQAWIKNPCVIANKIDQQIVNISYAIINGTWKHIEAPIIIDKHRAWARNIRMIKHFFGQDSKIIVTVRDIPSIVASFIQLIHKNPNNFVDTHLRQRGKNITDTNRSEILINEYIKDPWLSFKEGYETHRDSIEIVEYDDLTSNPIETVERVYSFMGLPKFTHDFNNIENDTVDDDLNAWGLSGLHTIRPVLNKTTKSAREVLGSELFNKCRSLELEFWRK